MVNVTKINNRNMFNEKITTAIACFHVGPLFGLNWNLKMLVFQQGREMEHPEKTLEQSKIEQLSQPIYCTKME